MLSAIIKLTTLILLASALVGAQSEGTPAAVSSGATPDSTHLVITKIEKAVYPMKAQRDAIQGRVMVKVLVSEKGDVENAEIVSGDPILCDAALDAAKKWKFKPFIKNGQPVKVTTKLPFDFAFSEKILDTSKNQAAASNASTLAATKDSGSTQAPASDTPPSPPTSSANSDDGRPKRVRVSSAVFKGMLLHKVAPVYPQAAKANRVQGVVVLNALIGKTGQIEELKAISGPADLIPAAIGAVQQWQYRPYLLLGQPVVVETTIEVHFRLSGY